MLFLEFILIILLVKLLINSKVLLIFLLKLYLLSIKMT